MIGTSVKAAKIAVLGRRDRSAPTRSKQMVKLAEKARKDGLLALENDLSELDDEYTQKGVQLVVDGADSDLVRVDPPVGDRRDGRAPRAQREASSRPPAGSRRPSGSSARS